MCHSSLLAGESCSKCGQLTAFSAASLGPPSAFPQGPCSSGPGHLWSSQDAFGSSLWTALPVGLADFPRQSVYLPSFPGELSLTVWKLFCLLWLPLPIISHRHNSKTFHPSNLVFKFDSWGTKSTQCVIYLPLPCKLVMNWSWGTFSIACFFVIHEQYIFLRKCFFKATMYSSKHVCLLLLSWTLICAEKNSHGSFSRTQFTWLLLILFHEVSI